MKIVPFVTDFRIPDLSHSTLPDLHQCKLDDTFDHINDALWAQESPWKACGLAAVKIRAGGRVLMCVMTIDFLS